MSSKSLSLPFLLSSTLLTLAVGTWILTTALTMTVGTPQQSETLLNKSGLYQAIIPSQVADAQKANPSLQNLPLDNPEVQKVLASSLDSKNLQAQGNKAVEAIYAWLEGKTAKPQINISVKADQQDLATAVGDYAVQYASKLPTCGPGEADYKAFASNPLSVTCMPPGTDANMVRSTVMSSVLNNPALGTSTQLTENDVKLNNGKTIMDSFNTAPKWYQRAQKLPLLAATAAGACILLILLILRPVQGIRSVGKNLLTVGIVLAVVAIGLAWGFEKLFSSFVPKSSNPNVADALTKLSNLFNEAYRNNIVHQSVYVATGGLVLLVLGIVLSRAYRTHAAPAAVPASSREAAIPVQPESLGTTPTAASFIPLGPPKLPTTDSAPTTPAKAPSKPKKAAKKKAPAKRAAKKKK